jgi:hypothetical protein
MEQPQIARNHEDTPARPLERKQTQMSKRKQHEEKENYFRKIKCFEALYTLR